jgi:hypothetical protein
LIQLTQAEAKDLATQLSEKILRPALPFEVYQEHAKGYNHIIQRTFE